MSEEFDFESIKNKALEQLKSGKPLLGKDGAFAPLLESILNAALEGEMDAHLSEDERMSGNRRNGRMKPILNAEDVKKLKIDEQLIECSCGKVNYYRFLCFHPRNTNYVILLNHCEEPVRFYVQHLIDRFYIDYTIRDIITYRMDYAIKKIKEFEQALSELGGKDEL